MTTTIGCDTTLLREWSLLQDEVIPPLLDIDDRVPRVWSIGCAEDAVAVAVAYSHASQEPVENLEVFASNLPQELAPVTFSLGDICCVPADSRTNFFTREDRHWVADESISDQVILADPPDCVDLVTVRVDPAAPVPEDVVDQLNVGGCLLVVSGSDSPLTEISALQPIDPERRLYRKRLQRRGRRRYRHVVEGVETLARNQMRVALIDSHMGLARALARRFARHGEPLDDLEQVASLALVKAARRFDPAKEAAFSSYATASITGELKRHFRDKAWMLRVPRSVQETYLAVKTAREELSHELGAVPTPEQIARHLGVDEASVRDALEAGDSYWPMSLDASVGFDGEPVEVPVVDGAFSRALDTCQISEAVRQLDPPEQLIVQRLFFDGWTQRQVADEIGVSQMHVSRVLSRVLAKLRTQIGEE